MSKLNLANLAAYLQARMDAENLTLRELEKRAKGLVKHGTFSNIRNQVNKDIELTTLEALEAALGVSKYYLMGLAFGEITTERPILSEEEGRFINSIASLTREQKDMLWDVLGHLLKHRIVGRDITDSEAASLKPHDGGAG